jgi:hypothetical protein
LREASAIDFSVPAEEPDGADITLEQLADLADALVEHVGAVREHYEQLQRTLEEPVPGPAVTVGGARPVEDSYRDDDPEGPPLHDSARLVVMEMAMSGSTRAETKAYLRDALDLEGGDPIVDEVFDRTEAAQAQPLHRRLFTRRRD